jgi:RNA polymerase sigma factor (sigma-70 family)
MTEQRTDGELLEQFVTRGDEPAFAALVRRHGPMVLAVCRRLAHRHQDAEDAFQVTFLVLARRAAAVQRRELLAGWLHGVACRVATRVRGQEARRRARERTALQADVEARPGAPPADEHQALHEEVARLPAKYRLPIVLCYLEGHSHGEAAGQLGWPIGTVKGRLARAREMLEQRLRRRGVVASVGMLTAGLAPVPVALAGTTARLARAFGDGVGGALPSRLVELTKEVLHTMQTATWAMRAALVLVVAVLGIGTGALTYDGQATEPRAEKVAKDKGDAARIQGTWKIVWLEKEGKKNVEGDEIKKSIWVISANKIVVKLGAEERESIYKIHPARKPKAIDVTPQVGGPEEKGVLVKGVYALDGDTLKICIPLLRHTERPKEVATKAGSGTMMLVFRRVPAKKR